MSYVVIAEFKARPDAIDSFRDAMTKHAYRSVTQEEGCYQFDVLQLSDDKTHFVLYERYANATAYAAHRADPRHPAIIELIAPMVERRDGNIFWNRLVGEQVAFEV